MAALDLHCGLDHGGRVWAGECVDLLDSFDSEMLEWEEQLQDMQRKIEELYSEVKARREAGENSPNTYTNLDITLLPVDTTTGFHADNYQSPSGCRDAISQILPVQPCNGMRNGLAMPQTNSVNYPSSYPNGVGTNYYSDGLCYPEGVPGNGGQDVTLDILNGYLGQGPGLEQSHNNVGPSSLSHTGKSNVYCCQNGDKQWPMPGRTGCVLVGKSEEDENRKNKGIVQDEAGIRHVSWKDPISSKDSSPEKSSTKPPFRQRNSHSTPPSNRSAHFTEPPQQQDKRCNLLDRKCGSPSVLRKFGAMLQENEGKTLIENGTVTTVVPAEAPKTPTTPVCQRKIGASRPSTRLPVPNCLRDSDLLMASLETVQEPWAAASPRHALQNGEHRCSSYATKPSYTNHTKSMLQGETVVNRKAIHTEQWGPGVVDIQSDYRMVERILGGCTGSQYQGKDHGFETYQGRIGRSYQMEGDLQHTNITSQRNTLALQQVRQVNHGSPSTAARKSFSRPSRPANQRPPSRWASQTPTAKISAPTGPMFHPSSPAHKHKQPFDIYNLYTETVIM